MEIASLKTHVRWIERGMIAMAVALAGLAGATWQGYSKLTDALGGVQVRQEGLSGRIDTLDAKLSGKLDLLSEQLSHDQPQASPRKR